MIFRMIGFIVILASSCIAQETRMDWKWGRPGVMVETNIPTTVTINGVPWWTATNGAFNVQGGLGLDSQGVTNIFNGMIVEATNGFVTTPGVSGIVNAAISNLPPSGMSATDVTNISTVVANSIVTAATNAIIQPTGVPYWIGTNGAEFATLEPDAQPLVWRVESTNVWQLTVTEALTAGGTIYKSVGTYVSDMPYPIQPGSWNHIGAVTVNPNVVDVCTIQAFFGVFDTEYDTAISISTYIGDATGAATLVYAPVIYTNYVTRLAATNDLAEFLSIADYALWQTNILDMIQAISNDAFNAQSTADGARGAANQAAQDAGTALQLISGVGGLEEQIDAKLDATGGTASNLTAVGTFSLFGYPWSWNPEFHTYDVGLDGGVTGQLFQEQHIYVKNGTDVPLTEGMAVCVAGGQGANVVVAPASCDSPICKWNTIGLVTQTGGIAVGEHGYVVTSGNINDLAGYGHFDVSNTLWLATSGVVTNIEPAAGSVAAKVKIGTVLRSHNTQGRIFVSVLAIPNAADVGAVAVNNGSGTNLTVAGLSTPYGYTNKYMCANGSTICASMALLSPTTNLQIKTQNGDIQISPAGNMGINATPSASYSLNLASGINAGGNVQASYFGTGNYVLFSTRGLYRDSQNAGQFVFDTAVAGGANPIILGSGGTGYSNGQVNVRLDGRNYASFTTNKIWFGLNSNVVVDIEGTVSATNFVFTRPRWIDEKATGLSLSPTPSAEPQRIEIPAGSGVHALAFSIGDNAAGSLQWQHGLAKTNALYQNLYYSPHTHTRALSTDGNDTATWVVKWQVAGVNGAYSETLARTTTVTYAEANTHYICDFGVVTNNALSGKDSVISPFTLYRIAGSNEVAADEAVVDSIDFHIPVAEYGSVVANGD